MCPQNFIISKGIVSRCNGRQVVMDSKLIGNTSVFIHLYTLTDVFIKITNIFKNVNTAITATLILKVNKMSYLVIILTFVKDCL